MTTPSLTLPLPDQISIAVKKMTSGTGKRKRVLLVDGCAAKRELRAEAMRKLGLDVDCACDIEEARSWWRADLYNLVLINMENESGSRDKFCEDIRAAVPPQQLAFLVGKPGYLAGLPLTHDINSGQHSTDIELDEQTESLRADTPEGPLPWGIMEASRRISAVRSVFAARSTAVRNRPTPPRDLEVKDHKRLEIMSQLASQLHKEDLL